eukprot:TRINITY_DN79997_c0_g1_i4.p1 TRINITY_DN79997_c0_g1~~TRINITY_DN79997_c0_g1_i4.p1  ORF type:complete len:154 (+),score=30.37 TRINITY_DN79997_c0_g1_i4:214-675(+)
MMPASVRHVFQKWNSPSRTSNKQPTLYVMCVVSDKFTKSSFRLTFAVAQWLCTAHLLACMDVEANPGPAVDEQVMQFIDWRFSQVINGIQSYTANACRLIEDKFGNLEKDFRSFTAEVRKLQELSQENREDIQGLQEDRDTILDRLHRLRKED